MDGDTLAVPGIGGPKTMAQGCTGYEEIPEGDPDTCDPLVAVGDKPCGFGAYWSAVDGGCRCLGNLELDDNTGICRFKGVVPGGGGPGRSNGNGGNGSNNNPGENDDDPGNKLAVELQCAPGSPARGDRVDCKATSTDAEGTLYYQWRFLPTGGGVTIWNGDFEPLLPVRVLGTRDSVWSGAVAAAGRVAVRVADSLRWAHAHVDFTVYPRVWSLSAGFKRGADLLDSLVLRPGDTIVSGRLGTNRDVATGSSDPRNILRGSAEVSAIGGGPNDGYAYVADLSYEIDRTWHVNTRLTETGPREIWTGSKLVNAWDYLVADKTVPHPKHMLAGTTGHEGTGANGGKGHQGQIDMILGRGVRGCGDAAAMAEGIVADTEDEARLLVEGEIPGNILGDSIPGIEDYAHNALELGMSHHYVYGNHADSSVFVYKDLSDNSYNTHPHRDLKGPKPVGRPLHSACDTIF